MRPQGLPVLLSMVMMCGSVSAAQLGEEKYSLRGQVVNAATGEAVSGALVEVQGSTRKAQFTTTEGRYEFAALPRGNYGVSARKPGYFNDRDLGREAPGTEATHAVPSDEELVLKLIPEGIISGRVEDEKGRPLEGVNVQVEMWMVAGGIKRLQPWPLGTVQTDDEGNFRIGELYPGDYLLKFSERTGFTTAYREGRARSRAKTVDEAEKGKPGYGTQYYPGVVDENTASAIRVSAGVEAPIRQVLEPLRLYEIAGVVRGAAIGEGFSVALMAAGSGFGELRGSAQVFRGTGEFRIEDVPAGKYLLSATAQDPTERYSRRLSQLVAQTVLEVNNNIAGVALILGHGSSIGVRVTAVSTKGADERHYASVTLQSTEFMQEMQQVLAPAPLNDMQAPRGFENVAVGTYSVEASPEGWGYVASIRCAGADLLKEDLRVGAGTAVAPIEITLRNDGATLNLSAVENGKPVAGMVIVYSEEYPKRSKAVTTWPTSTVDLANLAPGTYKLVATRGPREPEFRNPLAMAKYLSHAQSVTLAPESRVNVQVEVQEEPEP